MGTALLAAFALWTAMVQFVDVRPVGQNGRTSASQYSTPGSTD